MRLILIGILTLNALFGHSQNIQKMQKTKCVEMVIFKPGENVTNEELMQALKSTNTLVKGFNGFISRTTSINEKGEFLDVVYWESKKQALQAAQEAQKIPELMKLFALIDPGSIKMEHFDLFAMQE